MRHTRLIAAVSLCLPLAHAITAAEPHAAGIIADLLATRDCVLAAQPGAVFLAFWDFDGTILQGDCSEGMNAPDGSPVYPGLAQVCVERGLSRHYAGADAFARFWEDYRLLDERVGHWLAYPFIPQVFHGAKRATVESVAREHFNATLGAYYFASSIEILRALEAGGVENHVISASADVFVDAAAETLDLPVERLHGIEVAVNAEGRLTTELIAPVTWADGKVAKLLQIVAAIHAARPGAPVIVLGAFGNSYSTDGPFLEYTARLAFPEGRQGRAVMINGGKTPERYRGLFTEVTQARTTDLRPSNRE